MLMPPRASLELVSIHLVASLYSRARSAEDHRSPADVVYPQRSSGLNSVRWLEILVPYAKWGLASFLFAKRSGAIGNSD